MGEKMELKEAIDLFVRGEFYCSRQASAQLHDYDSISCNEYVKIALEEGLS